jgi:hypothetical protein
VPIAINQLLKVSKFIGRQVINFLYKGKLLTELVDGIFSHDPSSFSMRGQLQKMSLMRKITGPMHIQKEQVFSVGRRRPKSALSALWPGGAA